MKAAKKRLSAALAITTIVLLINTLLVVSGHAPGKSAGPDPCAVHARVSMAHAQSF